MNKFVLAVEKSDNSKTGLVSATYAPIQSCPKTCPFLDKGCYAQTSFCGIWLRKINKICKEKGKERARDIAREEAKQIKTLKGIRPLRLHVVGDCRTESATKVVTKACKEYSGKYGSPVWTYTHAWRTIDREHWGDISVFASCETIEQCHEAMARGYAASMVYPEQFSGVIKKDGLKLVACLEMSKGIKCNDCQLCFKDKQFHSNNRVICFFPHGSKAGQVKKTVSQ